MVHELTVYLDDSGHPDDRNAVVVGGWVATLEQWMILESQWKDILAEFHIDSGEFHRTDFQAGKGYAHLSCAGKTRLLYKLINQITTRVRYGFSCVIPMHDYCSANDKHYVEESLGKPYALAGSILALDIEHWKKQYAPSEKVVLIFEEGSKHKGDLEQVFMQCGFDRPSFRWKKDVPALQTADVLAWEAFHAFETNKIMRSFEKLCSVPGVHRMVTEENLIEACLSGRGNSEARSTETIRCSVP